MATHGQHTDGVRSPGFQHLIRHRDFRLIWVAQVAAQLADKFLMFSLIILAYHVSGANTPVAVTLLAYTVPAVGIAPLAGVFADRHDRKTIMVTTNLARALLIALIPLTAHVPAFRFDFLHLLLITFMFSAVGQLFSPAEAAAIPSVIPRSLLMTANSMVMATMVLTLVLGGALAPIVSRLALYAPYWVAVGLFVIAGALIGLARIPRPDRLPDRTRRHPFLQLAHELTGGWQALRGSPVLMFAFSQLSLAVMVMFTMFTLAPAYVSRVIGISAQDSYIILVPATIGCLISALVLGHIGSRLNPWWLASGALVATGLTLLALAGLPTAARHLEGVSDHARWLGTGFSFLLGLEFGALMIPSLSHLMEHSWDAVRGRVFALLFMIVNGATALPVLLAAALSDLVGTGHVVAAMGLLLMLTALMAGLFGGRVFHARTLS
jgi:MFS family permease